MRIGILIGIVINLVMVYVASALILYMSLFTYRVAVAISMHGLPACVTLCCTRGMSPLQSA